jgi:NAD(P)-dependent dehydrogenase (short-subunit alcohol dehydrogenase family)/acyl carrier protein
MQDVNKMDIIDPGKSTITGAIKVIPQEYTNILCRSIDVVLPGRENIKEENLINLLYDELNYKTPGVIAAYRGLSRWEQTLERVKLAAPREQSPVFKEKGVYLITGGLGGIGLTFSEYLGRNYKARLILTGRSFFPGKNEWQQWILDHKADDAVSKKILMFREWENAGAEILYLRVDIADASGMEKKISEAEQYFGVVNGIIHAAGILDYGGVIHNRGKDENEKVFAAKIYGTLALNDILQGRNLDFFVLCSSISAILPSFGEVGYASANGFLDAFARYRMIKEQSLTISINWSIWNDVGMGYRAYVEKNPEFSGNSFPNGINPREGVDIMLRSVRCGLPQLVVSAGDLNSMLENHKQSEEPREKFDVKSNAVERDRPDLLVEYTPPGTVTQEIMARIWGDFFGIKEIGIDDDFFELGGDSLKAMNLSNQMYRKFKVDIPLVEFFNKPAIRELALFIEAARGTGVISLKSVEKKDYYALSASQKRLYLLHNLGDRDYEISNQFEFGREINKEKWDEAFKILISRQESLRTSFRMAGETPVQVIHERGEVDFSINYYEEIKLNNLDEAIRIDKIREDFQQPFDLGKAPLIRIWQVKNVNNKYTVFFKIHHIITDALSNSIIMDEVYSIYSGQKTHPLPIQYKDFSEWQYRFLKSGELKRQEDYWLREFAGRKPQLKLPLDYDRTGEHGSGSITSFIRKDEAKKTDDIKKEQGVTMFMVMLAVYDILLAKLSGQEDIIVGTFTNGRDFAYLEKIVGMLVKTIVLRNRPAEDLTFREFLVQLKEKVLNAFKNQDYPFDRLVEKLHVDRQTGRNPLFDVAFNYFSNTDLESSREQKEDKKEINYAGHSLFDLVLVVYEQKDSFELIFSYDSRLFEQTTIERYVAYFKEIYAVVTNDPGILLGEIKISHRFAAAKSDIVADEKFEFNF